MNEALYELIKLAGDVIIKLNKNNLLISTAGSNSFANVTTLSPNIDFMQQLPPVLKSVFSKHLENQDSYNSTFFFSLNVDSQEKHFITHISIDDTHKYLLIKETDQSDNVALELQRSEKKFRIVLETAAQGILLVNIHGQIVLANNKIEKLFGYDRDELIDAPVELLVAPMYRDIHIHHRSNYIAQPVRKQMAINQEVLGRRKDGSEFPIDVHLTSVEMYDGPNIIAFITDISEQKKMQNKIRRMEKLEAIGQLAGGIAHDFNNVLAGIIGLSELALRKLPENSPAESNIKLVVEKSQGAAQLVKQLLAFSRQQVLQPKSLNLNHTINSSKKMLQRYLGEDIHLKLELENDLKNINADPSAIDQIVTNLCINARDAMPDGGDLIIKSENIDITMEDISLGRVVPQIDYIKLSICDSGVGMRQEVQKHVFEPFYSTKEFGQGTGLGLATVYGLVEQHNGVIQFESKPGEGTSFFLYFPASNKEESEKSESFSEQKISGGNETILIIDDEKDILQTASETLQLYGYKVFTAQNGVEGLQIFEKEQQAIQLVISDVVMPKMGGIELKMMIKNIKPDIKFLHMSAYSEKLSTQSGYLQKPFLSDHLLLRVREILNEK